MIKITHRRLTYTTNMKMSTKGALIAHVFHSMRTPHFLHMHYRNHSYHYSIVECLQNSCVLTYRNVIVLINFFNILLVFLFVVNVINLTVCDNLHQNLGLLSSVSGIFTSIRASIFSQWDLHINWDF